MGNDCQGPISEQEAIKNKGILERQWQISWTFWSLTLQIFGDSTANLGMICFAN
jgi:hypothetical protein